MINVHAFRKEEFINWAIEQHRNINHKYADILPYEFHLNLVYLELVSILEEYNQNFGAIIDIDGVPISDIISGCYGHDLIEDTNVTYNDVLNAPYSNKNVAEICYALTNEKGKNRKERANDKYYKDIRETPGASLVKFCDRIANVRFGILTRSNKVNMYKKENEHFMKNVYIDSLEPFKVIKRLENLFK